MQTRRWPGFVYDVGRDPDPRFTFANERTFLAWIRTSLALLAAGVALDAFDLAYPGWLQRSMAVLLIVLGLACALASWTRWARAERAMRRREPLPGSSGIAVLGVGVGLAALALLTVGL